MYEKECYFYVVCNNEYKYYTYKQKIYVFFVYYVVGSTIGWINVCNIKEILTTYLISVNGYLDGYIMIIYTSL